MYATVLNSLAALEFLVVSVLRILSPEFSLRFVLGSFASFLLFATCTWLSWYLHDVRHLKKAGRIISLLPVISLILFIVVFIANSAKIF